MKSVAALVVAVGMVVAALVIRDRIDDDGDADGSARLVCATELAEACVELDDASDGLDVTIESVRSTFDRLLAVPNEDVDDPGLDGWLVPEPWPAMVDVARAQEQLRPLFATDATRLARSPLVIIVRNDRARALAENACGGAVQWRCLGDVAGEPWTSVGGEAAWGRVKVGNADPTTSASGLAVVAQAASQYFETPDYFRDDLEGLDFQAWFGRLEGSARPVATPAIDMLRDFPAPPYDAAGTTEAEAGPALREAAPDRSRAFRLLYPEPVATADVVLALSASDTRDDDIEGLAGGGVARDALAGAGWRVADEPLGPGLDPDVQLDAASNLPVEPGVYLALQETWVEVT